MYNKLKFSCRATNCNGYPTFRVRLNGVDCVVDVVKSEYFAFELAVPVQTQTHVLEIERYGKTSANSLNEHDQILEILDVAVDNVSVPKFLIHDHCKFVFDDQTHHGSCYFGPNGTWTWGFETPLITYVLDKKILHEAQYNQDYKFAWSYRLGPDSANTILNEIESTIKHVTKIYE